LAARLAGAKRRAAVVTSAALLAGGGTALTVAPSILASDPPAVSASVAEPSVEAAPPPATLLPPVAPVSDVRETDVRDPAEASPDDAEAGAPIAGGQASYYGRELAGNPTASGEPFDPTALTAAHRTLPLGTRVRVTHARTGESVVVRINDRGPFHGDRVIDVSRAAADAIGLTRAGTAEVELERLPKSGGARG
jgi:rare lipoprotein A